MSTSSSSSGRSLVTTVPSTAVRSAAPTCWALMPKSASFWRSTTRRTSGLPAAPLLVTPTAPGVSRTISSTCAASRLTTARSVAGDAHLDRLAAAAERRRSSWTRMSDAPGMSARSRLELGHHGELVAHPRRLARIWSLEHDAR